MISPAKRDALYARDPHNIVRVEYGEQRESDTASDNRYTRAARFVRDWQQEGILTQDSARALYVYHQEFEVEGQRHTRRGFLARVRLERFGEGRRKLHPRAYA